jgi:hypothetical protein
VFGVLSLRVALPALRCDWGEQPQYKLGALDRRTYHDFKKFDGSELSTFVLTTIILNPKLVRVVSLKKAAAENHSRKPFPISSSHFFLQSKIEG